MRTMSRTFRFWLVLFAVGVVVFNAAGMDDYNILLFLISPMIWLHEGSRGVRSLGIPLAFYALSTVVIWFLAGWVLDTMVGRMKKIRNISE